jgi:hypothetical protein
LTGVTNCSASTEIGDNLNIHTPASFYEVIPPSQAKALTDRLEIHYTSKHASRLNISKIELSVLARHGLAHILPPLSTSANK